MKPGAVHKSPSICVKAEKKLGKPQLGNRLMNTLRLVIVSNGTPYLQITSVGSHIMSVKDNEGKEGVASVKQRRKINVTQLKTLNYITWQPVLQRQ